MADAIQTLPNTKNDLIISLVQKELKEKSFLFSTVEDLSRFAVKGAKSISVPKLTSFTAVSRTLGAAQDAVALTDSKDLINLDLFPYIAWLEDHADNYQSTIDYRIEASLRAASGHGRFVDNAVIAGLEVVASLNINGAAPADITAANILLMRRTLMEKNADMNMVVFVIAPDQEEAMLKLPEFSRYDYRGNGASPILNGQIGSVYGVPVMIHNGVKAQQAFMYEKSGFGVAFSQSAMMSEQDANEYGSMSKRVAMDQALGMGGLQQGVGAAESPLVTKLID